MSHKDIYTKFMIEYDKANVLSSYPSLTEYEVATFLDKAYSALIAQKVTGNNPRLMGLETDVKVIEDLSPLIVTVELPLHHNQHADDSSVNLYSKNIMYVDLPKGDAHVDTYASTEWNFDDTLPARLGSGGASQTYAVSQYAEYLYFISAALKRTMDQTPMDGHLERALPIKLVSHQMAKSFLNKAYNMPWIKQPVGYIEQNKLYIIYDPSDNQFNNLSWISATLSITYIKKPNPFAKDLSDTSKFPSTVGYYTLFDATTPNEYYIFECNDSMVEELISLAITYALENVESNRLSTKLNMRGLES